MTETSPTSIPDLPIPAARRYWIAFAVIVAMLLGVQIGVYSWAEGWKEYLKIGGGLKLTLPTNIRCYIGDRDMGTGDTYVSWEELLGSEYTNGMIRPMADPGVIDGNPNPYIPTAVGPGANTFAIVSYVPYVWTEPVKVLQSQDGSSGAAYSTQYLSYRLVTLLVQRGDESLDHVMLLDVRIGDYQNRTDRRYLIPFRFRTTDRALFYPAHSSSGVSSTYSAFGSSSNELVLTIKDSRPPDNWAETIRTKGLYEPSRSPR